MEDKNYKPRIIDSKIEKCLSLFGALSIYGPSGCGKTTTGIKHTKSQFFLSEPFGNSNNRQLAEMEPSSFLSLNQWWKEIYSPMLKR